MNICIIIGAIAVGLTWIMAAVELFFIRHKIAMISATVSGTILMPFISLTFHCIQQAICYYAPEVWWISILFFLFILCILLAMWFMLIGTLIVKEDCIYRLGWYMVFRKYTYADVDHYIVGWDTSTIVGRFGSRKVSTYEIDIQFNDKTYSSISFRNENVPKAVLLRDNLRSHRCRRKK